ncbi:MAG TPA: hypothetical protein VEO56_13075 [Bacteroidota bacterium]|nr:hypothetical protein [Bacteroidota bacterium]
MSIQTFDAYRRSLSTLLVMALLLALADVPALARPGSEGAIRVSNQDVRVEGDVVLVSYELDATPGESYAVELVLLREGDPTFRLVPSNAAGEVGEVKATPGKHLIRWEYKKDSPQVLHGDDYYFRIEVSRSGGGVPWLWVGLGTAAVAGVVVAVMGGKSPAGTPTTTQTQELPLPPPR